MQLQFYKEEIAGSSINFEPVSTREIDVQRNRIILQVTKDKRVTGVYHVSHTKYDPI